MEVGCGLVYKMFRQSFQHWRSKIAFQSRTLLLQFYFNNEGIVATVIRDMNSKWLEEQVFKIVCYSTMNNTIAVIRTIVIMSKYSFYNARMGRR